MPGTPSYARVPFDLALNHPHRRISRDHIRVAHWCVGETGPPGDNPALQITRRPDGSLSAWCFKCDWPGQSPNRRTWAAVRRQLGVSDGFEWTPPPIPDELLTPPPAPIRRPYAIPSYRPAPAPLLPGTGWPRLYDGQSTYKSLRSALPGSWTAWLPITGPEGTRNAIRHFPGGGQKSVYDGGKGWNMAGTMPTLWPTDAAAAADPIIQVEGEADGAAVASIPGLAASSLPGGLWQRADWTPLAGRTVVIIPDADLPGWTDDGKLAHPAAGQVNAAVATAALTELGCTVAVVPRHHIMAAAAIAGHNPIGAGAADLRPDDIKALVAAALRMLEKPGINAGGGSQETSSDPVVTTPALIPPKRPASMACPNATGALVGKDSKRGTIALPGDCHSSDCDECEDYRRLCARHRWDDYLEAIGSPAQQLVIEWPATSWAAAADTRTRIGNRLPGVKRWTGLRDDACRVVLTDANDLDDEGQFRMLRMLGKRGINAVISCRSVTGADIAGWTPHQRSYKSDGDEKRAGIDSTSWPGIPPQRNIVGPKDYALGRMRRVDIAEYDGPLTGLTHHVRMMRKWVDLPTAAVVNAYDFTLGGCRRRPPPDLSADLVAAKFDGNRKAFRRIVDRIRPATGYWGDDGLLWDALDDAPLPAHRRAFAVVRHWLRPIPQVCRECDYAAYDADDLMAHIEAHHSTLRDAGWLVDDALDAADLC